MNERVRLQLVPFPIDSFRPDVSATDAEVAAHYEANREDFRVGERRQIHYVLVDVERDIPVATAVTVIVAPGTGAPAWSLTSPASVPAPSCATTDGPIRQVTARHTPTLQPTPIVFLSVRL